MHPSLNEAGAAAFAAKKPEQSLEMEAPQDSHPQTWFGYLTSPGSPSLRKPVRLSGF